MILVTSLKTQSGIKYLPQMCFLSSFWCMIIFMCSVNFWHQPDSNLLFKGALVTWPLSASGLFTDLSVYYIMHSLLSRLRKPFWYSQISSKFKHANGYTVMTWYFGSLHVKWRLRAQICHHLKFKCVTRACVFLTVFQLKTHTKRINWFISDYCTGCDAWKNFSLLAQLLF